MDYGKIKQFGGATALTPALSQRERGQQEC